MSRGLLHRLVRLLVCLGVLACGLARAQGVDVGVADQKIDLWGQLLILEDRDATLSPQSALARSDWQTATPRLMSQGTTESAFWLRLGIVNHAPGTITRWLSLGSQQLEDVRFYRHAGVRCAPV